MQDAGYGNWKTVVGEHIIHVIEVRFTYLKLGNEAGDKELTEQKNRGFKYVELLADKFKTYEKTGMSIPLLPIFLKFN